MTREVIKQGKFLGFPWRKTKEGKLMPTSKETLTAANNIRSALEPMLDADGMKRMEAILSIKTPAEELMKAVTALIVGVRNGMDRRIRNGWDAMIFQMFYDWWRSLRELGEKAGIYDELPTDWLELAMEGEVKDESE